MRNTHAITTTTTTTARLIGPMWCTVRHWRFRQQCGGTPDGSCPRTPLLLSLLPLLWSLPPGFTGSLGMAGGAGGGGGGGGGGGAGRLALIPEHPLMAGFSALRVFLGPHLSPHTASHKDRRPVSATLVMAPFLDVIRSESTTGEGKASWLSSTSPSPPPLSAFPHDATSSLPPSPRSFFARIVPLALS